MMEKDALDHKVLEHFDGKALRKDLLHRIKKGTNIPTFVLEFLLAKFCASDDPTEIEAGLEAVLSSLSENYVRPDEANTAQSRVALHGKHRFIDKVHVKYSEKEKRHWASLENFNSNRVAIAEKFFRSNDRMLQGGLWAEVTLAHNDLSDDDYAFYVQDLRPIQLAKFDFARYTEGRSAFTRDEWLDLVLRSVGLEPTVLTLREKFHFILRMAPLVEPNYNYIELGPRGTGKSYFFSEFSPYATLISGGQATKATLFYNNARNRVGLVGHWDVVAFDEVAGMKIKDPDTVQIMKDYMANGRFSRGVEVIGNASFSFVGNFDLSISQVVHSSQFDLLHPLPAEFDLAIMDRFAAYLPGWEMPKNSSAYLTVRFGLITDYLAEAFHYQFIATNRYDEVKQRIKLGSSVEGRDEKGVIKTVGAFLKVLHPNGPPSNEEFESYVTYALECRRRVKEQMNKRKPDDEFARINLSFFSAEGQEVVVFCPESKNAPATQTPLRKRLNGAPEPIEPSQVAPIPEPARTALPPAPREEPPPAAAPVPPAPVAPELREQHFTINYGDVGYSYDSIVGPYLAGVKHVHIEDPYVRLPHQLQNFVRFCEMLVVRGAVRRITLCTNYETEAQRDDVQDKLNELRQSLLELDIEFGVAFDPYLHDRQITLDNGWIIKIGRGLDIYQKPNSWFEIGAVDLSMRKCLMTNVDIYRRK